MVDIAIGWLDSIFERIVAQWTLRNYFPLRP